MESKKIENGYILRLVRGEELLASLQKFCAEQNITSGWLSGLGGATHIKLSYYDLEKKEYITKEFNELMEVTNLTGNIATIDGATVFHIHASLGKSDYTAYAGHIDHLSVGGTLEIFLWPFSEELTRKKDEEIGLPLLDLK